MEPVKCLFGVVVVLACAAVAATQHHNMPNSLSHQLLQQTKVPVPEGPSGKCHVEEHEKIQCGTADITAEQCEHINCCFSGRQCYYGKAGIRALCLRTPSYNI